MKILDDPFQNKEKLLEILELAANQPNSDRNPPSSLQDYARIIFYT